MMKLKGIGRTDLQHKRTDTSGCGGEVEQDGAAPVALLRRAVKSPSL